MKLHGLDFPHAIIYLIERYTTLNNNTALVRMSPLGQQGKLACTSTMTASK